MSYPLSPTPPPSPLLSTTTPPTPPTRRRHSFQARARSPVLVLRPSSAIGAPVNASVTSLGRTTHHSSNDQPETQLSQPHPHPPNPIPSNRDPDHPSPKPPLSPSPSINWLVPNQSRPTTTSSSRCTSLIIDYPIYPPRSSSLSHKSVPIRCSSRLSRIPSWALDSIHSSSSYSNMQCFSPSLSPSPSISRHSRSSHFSNNPTVVSRSSSITSRPRSQSWLSRTPNYDTTRPSSSRSSLVTPPGGGGANGSSGEGGSRGRRKGLSRSGSMRSNKSRLTISPTFRRFVSSRTSSILIEDSQSQSHHQEEEEGEEEIELEQLKQTSLDSESDGVLFPNTRRPSSFLSSTTSGTLTTTRSRVSSTLASSSSPTTPITPESDSSSQSLQFSPSPRTSMFSTKKIRWRSRHHHHRHSRRSSNASNTNTSTKQKKPDAIHTRSRSLRTPFGGISTLFSFSFF